MSLILRYLYNYHFICFSPFLFFVLLLLAEQNHLLTVCQRDQRIYASNRSEMQWKGKCIHSTRIIFSCELYIFLNKAVCSCSKFSLKWPENISTKVGANQSLFLHIINKMQWKMLFIWESANTMCQISSVFPPILNRYDTSVRNKNVILCVGGFLWN